MTSENSGYSPLRLDGATANEPGAGSLVPGGGLPSGGLPGSSLPGSSAQAWYLDPVRSARLAYVFFLIAPLPWVIAYFLPPLNHDAAAILHFAQRWLGGERLYVDLIDVNPPLIFVLNLVPAAIARWTSLSGPLALTACVLGWIAVALGLGWRLLQVSGSAIGDAHRYVFPPLFLFLMIVFPGPDFAQREHLMMVATLPYLLLAHARVVGSTVPRSLAIGVSVFAALAFALKPHFLLLPLLVEAFVITACGLRRSARSPVPWTLGAVFAAYGLFMLLVTPAYLNTVVPLAIGHYRDLGGLGPWGVLFTSKLSASAALLLPLSAAALLRPDPLPRLIAVAAVASVVAAMAQGKGWPYHVLPAESFVLLLAAALLCNFVDSNPLPNQVQRRKSSMVVMISIMLAGYYLCTLTRPTFWRQADFSNSPSGQLLQRFGQIAGRGPILALSPGIYPHFPMVNYANTTMGMRFMSMWPIQGAYAQCPADGGPFRRPSEMSPAESFAYNAIVDDFHRYQPSLVLIDKEPGIQWCAGKDFDYLAYFRTHPVFAADWEKYRLLTEYDRYRVYVRR